MTDRERLTALLASFGITPSTSKYLPDRYLDGSHVVLYEGDGGVRGYPDYFCAFAFDQAGRFVSVEVRE
ncbi:MAG TPA: hypothetical protein VE441_16880 [Mycobacterium sp.]|jgi:hypothetical protein|nr:hypothetical protein [Mycobacterium sp.]